MSERGEEMVRRQLEAHGIVSAAVLDAMRRVPREAFVPAALRASAYEDRALPISYGQSISQPFVVARMVEALDLAPSARVLEIGTGSGYAAAVLAEIAAEVVTVERLEPLATEARERLAALGYRNVEVVVGDGSGGWPARAPYDGILVSAGAPALPTSLVGELAPGGRLVIPVGARPGEQRLLGLVKEEDGTLREERLGAVRFVPLVGDEGWPDDAGAER